MTWRIKDARDVAKIADPRLRALIVDAAGPEFAPPSELSHHSGKVSKPREIYIIDPKKELLLRHRLNNALYVFETGDVAQAKVLVQEALDGLHDLGPFDALFGLFKFLERVRKSWKGVWYGWPGRRI